MKQLSKGVLLGIAVTMVIAAGLGTVKAHTENELSVENQDITYSNSMPCEDLDEMDQNNDNICDTCGMDLDHCLQMHGSGGHISMHERMHGS